MNSKPRVDVRFTDIHYEIPPQITLSGRLKGLVKPADAPSPTKILHGISGYVAPGQSLAVLGPSGSGKTTFLNLLAGRSQHPPSSGQILFAGAQRVARTKRHIGYVMQDDVFFSKLTVLETLQFTANIRLPQSMSRKDKMKRVDSVMRQLRLTKCRDTRIGDQQFDKGISGGERKRVNIANELLHDPSLVLADECTSGLDSSSAYTVINLLKDLCNEGRTVISTIHQPSSQMFALFDNIMVLAAGHVTYFGSPHSVIQYFESIDFPFPRRAYNPADYLLELVIDDLEDELDDKSDHQASNSEKPPSTQQRIIDAWKRNQPAMLEASERRSHRQHANTEKQLKDSSHVLLPVDLTDDDSASIPEQDSSLAPSVADDMLSDPVPPGTLPSRIKRALSKRYYDITGRHSYNMPEKYAVSWFGQVRVLAHRAFLQKRGLLIQGISIAQVVSVSVVSALFWWRMEPREGTIDDRLGAVSFFSIFWAFFSTFNALFAFPTEKQVLNKDRAGGSYRLSAYYFAKTMVETPADMIYPIAFALVVYWTIGMNPHFLAFLLFVVILVLDVLTAQSVGLFVSAAVMDVKQGQVVASIWILASMLISGYYIDPNNTPKFVEPLRNLSFIKYSYEAMVRTEMLFGVTFKCSSDTGTVYSNVNCPIGLDEVLRGAQLEDSLSIGGSIGVLILFIVVMRVAGYIALKMLHTSHKPKSSTWKQESE